MSREDTQDTLYELRQILDQLASLGYEVERLVRQLPGGDSHAQNLEAYGCFTFGSSPNPYDRSLEKLLDEIESGEYDDYEDEDEDDLIEMIDQYVAARSA